MKETRIAILALLAVILGCSCSTHEWVSKEFHTPGAIVAAHPNADAAKQQAEQLLSRAAAVLSDKGYTVNRDSRWHWNYYAESNAIWFQYLTFDDAITSERIGSFQCNVVQTLSSNLWTLSVEPFPVGSKRGSTDALHFYDALLKKETQ